MRNQSDAAPDPADTPHTGRQALEDRLRLFGLRYVYGAGDTVTVPVGDLARVLERAAELAERGELDDE